MVRGKVINRWDGKQTPAISVMSVYFTTAYYCVQFPKTAFHHLEEDHRYRRGKD